ncbi:MAG TPA: Fe-S cluster assembly protein SufD [Mycobacteriales bacterium]|jgi:Fe-S cluster assembly protein SufD
MTTQVPVLAEQSGVEQPHDARAQGVRSYDAADFPVPTGREEEWRFTPLKQLGGLLDGTAKRADEGPEHVVGDLPAGVTSERVTRDDPRVGAVLVPFDRASAVAYGEASDALVVSVARNAVVETPVVVGVRGRGADGASYGHTVVEVGDGAEVTVVLDHTGAATLSDNVEITVGANASLTFVTVQDFDRGSVHLQHQRTRLAADARLHHVSVSLGGDLVRQYTSVEYTGRGGDAEAVGIYFADAGQHLEHRLLADHSVPDCRSNVIYRGALQGDDAHTVWVGDVVIRAAATGTDTYEINRNLLLSDGARADSVPNLEIETGEIAGAGHASATGRFDDEQLFYLMARGIPADEARRLVVRGFFAELLHRIPVPELRDRLMATIEGRLSEVGA